MTQEYRESELSRQGFASVSFRDIDESTQPGSALYGLWLLTYGSHDIAGSKIARLVNSVNAEMVSGRAERQVLFTLRALPALVV